MSLDGEKERHFNLLAAHANSSRRSLSLYGPGWRGGDEAWNYGLQTGTDGNAERCLSGSVWDSPANLLRVVEHDCLIAPEQTSLVAGRNIGPNAGIHMIY